MTRLSTLFTTVLPSMIAGGLLFGSTFGRADAGRDEGLGFWPATGDTGILLAQAPPPPEPPEPPMPPRAPRAPHGPRVPVAQPPAVHGHHHGSGVSVSIHDGKIEVDGVKDLVGEKLDAVREMLEHNQSIPEDVRRKILERLDKVHNSVDRRLKNFRATDMEQFGEEMERMGEDIEKSMEGLGDDLQQLGDQTGKNLGKGFAKSFKKGNFQLHWDSDDGDKDNDSDKDDDADDAPSAPEVDADDADLKAAIKDLGSLALKPGQREQIARLRIDSDRAVATAKQELESLSTRLHDALANPSIGDAEIARYVDQISAQESAMRKARLLAWANARRLLDDGQRKRVEDAAAKKKTK